MMVRFLHALLYNIASCYFHSQINRAGTGYFQLLSCVDLICTISSLLFTKAQNIPIRMVLNCECDEISTSMEKCLRCISMASPPCFLLLEMLNLSGVGRFSQCQLCYMKVALIWITTLLLSQETNSNAGGHKSVRNKFWGDRLLLL